MDPITPATQPTLVSSFLSADICFQCPDIELPVPRSALEFERLLSCSPDGIYDSTHDDSDPWLLWEPGSTLTPYGELFDEGEAFASFRTKLDPRAGYLTAQDAATCIVAAAVQSGYIPVQIVDDGSEFGRVVQVQYATDTHSLQIL